MRAIQRQSALAIELRNPVVAGRESWVRDADIDAYRTSNLEARFACDCGQTFVPDGMTRCAGCDRTWNGFIISGNNESDGEPTKLVRSVPEHRERVLSMKTSKRKMAGWVKHSVEAGLPSFVRMSHGEDTAPTVFEKQAISQKKALGDRSPAGGGDRPPASTPGAGGGAANGGAAPDLNSIVPPAGMADAMGQGGMMGAGGMPGAGAPGAGSTQDPRMTPNALTGRKKRSDAGWGNTQQSQPAGGYTPAAVPKPAVPGAAAIPAIKQPAGSYKAPKSVAPTTPAATTPAGTGAPQQWGPPAVAPVPGATGVVPQQPGVAQAPLIQQQQQVAPQTIGQPAQQRTYKMAFSEDDYRMGWALASTDSPLPDRSRTIHASFLEGYRDFYREVVADKAPGWDTVAPDFQKPEEGINNSMSDYTDQTFMHGDNDGAAITHNVRMDLKDKLDRDNAKGQSRSNDSIADFSGWKSSALLEELNKRLADRV